MLERATSWNGDGTSGHGPVEHDLSLAFSETLTDSFKALVCPNTVIVDFTESTYGSVGDCNDLLFLHKPYKFRLSASWIHFNLVSHWFYATVAE